MAEEQPYQQNSLNNQSTYSQQASYVNFENSKSNNSYSNFLPGTPVLGSSMDNQHQLKQMDVLNKHKLGEPYQKQTQQQRQKSRDRHNTSKVSIKSNASRRSRRSQDPQNSFHLVSISKNGDKNYGEEEVCNTQENDVVKQQTCGGCSCASCTIF